MRNLGSVCCLLLLRPQRPPDICRFSVLGMPELSLSGRKKATRIAKWVKQRALEGREGQFRREVAGRMGEMLHST